MSVDITSQNLQAPCRALFEYWLKIRGSKAVPFRSDLRPGDIASLLPNLIILEYRDPDQLIYRLTGTEIVYRMGYDFTGKNLYEIAIPEEVDSARYQFDSLRAQPCGLVLNLLLRSKRDVAFVAELIFLPLSDRDGTINQLVAIVGEIKDDDKSRHTSKVASMTALNSAFLDIGCGVPAKWARPLKATG